MFIFENRKKLKTTAPYRVVNSVADPERFDSDADPTFHADADPDPNFVARERKKNCLHYLQPFFLKSYKTCDV